jgi:hypothetical protein
MTHSDDMTSTLCSTTFTRTWKAMDAHGNESTWQQTIIEKDENAPVASTLPTDKSIACDQNIEFSNVTFYDVCHPELMLVNFTDQTSTPTCGQSGFTTTRTWSANDGCNNLTNVSQKITVLADQTAPTFVTSNFPEIQLTQAQLAVWTPNQSIATDNCSSVGIAPTNITVIDQCHVNLTITATDACGNQKTAIQPVKITDGACTVSGTNDLNNQSIRIYPNPVSDNLFVEFAPGETTIEGNEKYQVQDVLGRILITGNLAGGKAEISVNDLQSGAYFLKMYNNQGELSVKRFVKTN